MFPVLSEAVTGKKQAVGIPYFNTVNVPLFLVLLFLMAVGPLIAWRKASWQSIRRSFLIPFVTALFLGIALVWAGITNFYPLLAYCLSAFVILSILTELHRTVQTQQLAQTSLITSAGQLLRRHSTRYGGHLVHIGVALVTIAITASMAHKIEQEFTLAKGESKEIGRFRFTLDDVGEREEKNFAALYASVSLSRIKDGSVIGELHPELRQYVRNNESTTEVALRMGAREDVYLIVAGLDESGNRVAFKAFINPLQFWLWVGVLVMLLGVVIVLEPWRRRVRVVQQSSSTIRVAT
jgi:cytochrome c-type biogenesis protein CcmF